jgi:hypothetical protein
MHVKFTHVMAVLTSLCVFGIPASAKVWRVNNNPGVSADFISLTAAITHVSVAAGDTVYIEPSATGYASATLNKRLVLIGAGYFLSGATGNAGLQLSPYATNITQINCLLAGSGSKIMGIDGYIGLAPDTDDMTITGCNTIVFPVNEVTPPNPTIKNLTISKCYLDFRMNTYALENPRIINSIILNTLNATNVINGLVRNNTIRNLTPAIQNCYVSNNIFSNVSSSASFVNCTLKYNIATTNLLPTDPAMHNTNNVAFATLFVGTGSTDGQYRLLPGAGNPAIGGGEPVNGVTPDCGAYGTDDPYRLSGIPAIPTIYTLTVPTSVPASATSMDITISTRANN